MTFHRHGPFNEAFLKTEANNGETMEIGKSYVFLAQAGSDVDLNLPDGSGVAIGSSITCVLATAGGIDRAVFTNLGGDIIVGLGSSGAPGLKLQGDTRIVEFVFFGSLLGAPTWLAISGGEPANRSSRITAECATTVPLPTFTSAGSGPDQILTATANGALIVDGVSPQQDFRDGVLVASEIGADRQFHGVYDLLEPGDGATPWKLRRRTDWALNGNVLPGTTVFVQSGTFNKGKAYISPSGINIGDTFDWIINDPAAVAEQTLTDGATITYDGSIGENANVTLGGDRILDWTNLEDGQRGVIRIIQDGTPPRLITSYRKEGLDTLVDFAGGTAPTLTNAGGAVDVLEWYFDGTDLHVRVFSLDSK